MANYDLTNCIGSVVKTSKGKKGKIERVSQNNIFVKWDNDPNEKCYDFPKDFISGYLSTNDPNLQQILNSVNKVTKIKTISKSLSANSHLYSICADPLTTTKLKNLMSYGTNAKEIYTALCNNPAFNADSTQIKGFGMYQNQYAREAIDNVDVWMISHTENEGTRVQSGRWENTISDDWTTITEVGNDTSLDISKYWNEVENQRLIFVKLSNNYVFAGLYKVDEESTQITSDYRKRSWVLVQPDFR